MGRCPQAGWRALSTCWGAEHRVERDVEVAARGEPDQVVGGGRAVVEAHLEGAAALGLGLPRGRHHLRGVGGVEWGWGQAQGAGQKAAATTSLSSRSSSRSLPSRTIAW